MLGTRVVELLFAETRIGRHYALNYDRYVADAAAPLFAVIDSECDDGFAGYTVTKALSEAGAELSLSRATTLEQAKRVLSEQIERAHRALHDASHRGGASVTAVTRAQDVLIVAHVGDCRLYVREPTGWVRKTRDHTLLEQVIQGGVAPLDSDIRLYQRGIITNTVGLSPHLELDVELVPLRGAREFLLVTRGAWMPLDPDGSARPLPGSVAAEDIGTFVLEQYVRDGERDNATLLVARA